MSNQRRTFLLLGLIVAVLLLGIAYAAIENVTLSVAGNVTASPDQGNFKVAFTKAEASGSGGSTQSLTSETSAIMNVYDLKSVGDTRTIVFTIANTSTDITAYLSNTVNHNNTEYFEVTATLGTTTLAPVNGTTTLSVKVELIKTPISGPVSDTITASITASPTPIGDSDLISFTFSTVATDYDAEPEYVYGEPIYPEKTFTISLQAEEGMTLDEWVDSGYNTVGAYMTEYNGYMCVAVAPSAFGLNSDYYTTSYGANLGYAADYTPLEIIDGANYSMSAM